MAVSDGQRERLAAAIDHGRRRLARAVREPSDLSSAATIALSRHLDVLIATYLRLGHPAARRPPR